MNTETFDLIYADPPWSYKHDGIRGSTNPHYETMTLEGICGLKVPSAKNSVLYLWATAPLLPEGLEVMRAWGFRYRSCAVWDKEILGVGCWFRGQHEILMVGIKGKVSPPQQHHRISSVIRCRRGRHSSKPDYVRHVISMWYPDARKLEMFGRVKHNGWFVFGNEVEEALFTSPDCPTRQIEIAMAD